MLCFSHQTLQIFGVLGFKAKFGAWYVVYGDHMPGLSWKVCIEATKLAAKLM